MSSVEQWQDGWEKELYKIQNANDSFRNAKQDRNYAVKTDSKTTVLNMFVIVTLRHCGSSAMQQDKKLQQHHISHKCENVLE